MAFAAAARENVKIINLYAFYAYAGALRYTFDPSKNAANLRKHGADRSPANGTAMKKAYNFSKGRRGAVLTAGGKTRITIFLDDAIVQHFKTLSERTGKGYQTLINDALAERIAARGTTLTAAAIRRIVREEIAGLAAK